MVQCRVNIQRCRGRTYLDTGEKLTLPRAVLRAEEAAGRHPCAISGLSASPSGLHHIARLTGEVGPAAVAQVIATLCLEAGCGVGGEARVAAGPRHAGGRPASAPTSRPLTLSTAHRIRVAL